MPEKNPSGNGEFVWEAEIVEIKSEVQCKHCGGEIGRGSMHMQDTRNQDVYHIGCKGAAAQSQPMLNYYCKPKSWPNKELRI